MGSLLTDLYSSGARLERQTATLKGVATSFADYGSGPAVVLVHGSGPGNDGDLTWRPVVAPLATRHRVIVLDVPGYGGSEMLKVADTPANVAEHVLALLDHLGLDDAVLAGHSRGGRICCEAALAAPKRARGLIVIAAGSVAPDGLRMPDGTVSTSAMSLVWFGTGGDSSFERFRSDYHTMVVDPTHLPDEILAPAYEEFMTTRVEEYRLRMAALDPVALYQRQDPAALSAITVPTCLIWGREDVTSPYGRAVALVDTLPDVELHVLSDCAHFVTADRPDELVSLMANFIDRQSAS